MDDFDRRDREIREIRDRLITVEAETRFNEKNFSTFKTEISEELSKMDEKLSEINKSVAHMDKRLQKWGGAFIVLSAIAQIILPILLKG